ncbi:TetR/AcrR family transcriptional regulator [Streptomyces phaeochromogenes]|uniref:TetR/AcrR family transcriptional regulator n=1 Tax=Streptomyces phaeochromogenes TaxID=1923 RepID=UPI00367D967F
MESGRGHEVDERTARARIRDAALGEFARRGMGGATIRGIAEAAGVSPGLVQHHFGSKEELRAECDRYAFDMLRRTKRDALQGGMDDPNFLPVVLRAAAPVQRYVARALVDGSPAAAALFDDIVRMSETVLKEGGPGTNTPNTSDLHAYSAVMTAMNLGILVLHEHLTRALGTNPLSPEGYPRLGLALLDIYADDLIGPDIGAQARAALEAMRNATSERRAGQD